MFKKCMHHVPENTINIMWWKSNVLVFYPKQKKMQDYF